MYLEQGDLQTAYSVCKKDENEYINLISIKYGDKLFEEGKYVEAAQIYFDSILSLEDIFVKFQKNDISVKDGLYTYINLYLDKY